MSYTLLSTDVPVPTGTTGYFDPASATDSTTPAPVLPAVSTGAFAGFATWLNKLLAQVGNASLGGGGGYGVISGLGLTAGAGLSLGIAAGAANIGVPVVIASTTTTLPDNTARVWVWLKRDGTVQVVATSLTPPATDCVLLGSAVTSAGSITSVDYSGVCYVRPGGLLLRNTADRGYPADAPTAGILFRTITLAGTVDFDGTAYKALGPMVNTETITATKVLATTDAEIHVLTPSGASRNVQLPASAPAGKTFTIYNAATSGANSVVVKADDGTTTIATLTNGQKLTVNPIYGGSRNGKYTSSAQAADSF